MATTKRTNDLYCREVPAARTIDEIKHAAAIKRTTVGVIVHREHALVRAIREAVKSAPGGGEPVVAVGALLKKHGLDGI